MKNLMMFCVFVTIFYLNAVFNVEGQSTLRLQGPNNDNCTQWRKYVWSMCTLTKKCSASSTCRDYPEATCRLRHGRCGECVERFFIGKNEVLCNEECPTDQPAYDCAEPACDHVQCDDRAIRELPCRSSRCGKCLALFRFEDGWRECPGARYNITGRPRAPTPRTRRIQMGRNSIQRATADFLGGAAAPRPSQSGRMAGPGDVAQIVRCPESSPEVPCSSDLCTNVTCQRHPDAKCVIDRCGVCHADWMVGKKIVNCNVRDRVEPCPPGVPALPNCNACNYAYCENFPDAECRNYDCGKCKAEFFVDNRKVECITPPNYVDPCPNPIHERYKCPKEMCRFHVCPNNHRVYCTVDNCGSCKAVYRYKWSREVTTCRGYWSRYENDTARKGYVATEQDITASLDAIIARFESAILAQNDAFLQDQSFLSIPQELEPRQGLVDRNVEQRRNQSPNTDIRREPTRRREAPPSLAINEPSGSNAIRENELRSIPVGTNVINDNQPNIRRGIPVVHDPHAGHGHDQMTNRVEQQNIIEPQSERSRLSGDPRVQNLILPTQEMNLRNAGDQPQFLPSERTADNRRRLSRPADPRRLTQTNRSERPGFSTREQQQPPETQFLSRDHSQRPQRRLSRRQERQRAEDRQRPQNRLPSRPERPQRTQDSQRPQNRLPNREETQRTQESQRSQNSLPTRPGRQRLQERQRPQNRLPSRQDRQRQEMQRSRDRRQEERQRPQNRLPTRRERQQENLQQRGSLTNDPTPTNRRRPERIPLRTERRRTESTTSLQANEQFLDGRSTRRNIDRTGPQNQNLPESLSDPRSPEPPLQSNGNSASANTDLSSANNAVADADLPLANNGPNNAFIQSPLFDAFSDLQFPLFDLFNMENSAGIPLPIQQNDAPQGA